MLSNKLHLPPSIAGMTLLALGNGQLSVNNNSTQLIAIEQSTGYFHKQFTLDILLYNKVYLCLMDNIGVLDTVEITLGVSNTNQLLLSLLSRGLSDVIIIIRMNYN